MVLRNNPTNLPKKKCEVKKFILDNKTGSYILSHESITNVMTNSQS